MFNLFDLKKRVNLIFAVLFKECCSENLNLKFPNTQNQLVEFQIFKLVPSALDIEANCVIGDVLEIFV